MLASIKTLFFSIVDYAGLFPPAKLELQQAMANYARYRTTSDAWMLGRFVLPASRGKEFTELLPAFSTPQQWFLSLILSSDIESDIEKVRALKNSEAIAVASVEIPPLPPTQIEKVLSYLPKEVELFFEIPLHGDFETYLAVICGVGASVKIRTGGVTADAFPSPAQLCKWMFALAAAGVSFKATAGLHHPLPGKYPLPGQSNNFTAIAHGFLNVAVVAALIYQQKIQLEAAVELLQQSSTDNLHLTPDGILWQNYQLNLVQIEKARQNFFRSFGSCSFQEPVEGLRELKLLN